MEARDLIIDQIRGLMANFLKGYDSSTSIPSIRILGDTPNSILDDSQFLQSIKIIIEEVESSVALYRPGTKSRWIATNKFGGRRSFFVLDLNNIEYEYESAHTCRTLIPVYVLRLSKSPKIFRHEPQDQNLAEKLAQMHDLHGKKPLPLFDDHTKPLIYDSPRNLRT